MCQSLCLHAFCIMYTSFKQAIVVADFGQGNTAGLGQEEVTKRMLQLQFAAEHACLCYQIMLLTLHAISLYTPCWCTCSSCNCFCV